ncbi:putative premnaspirodiene oxygenase [Helianthus annuus]|uniref:Premnaspirodiene oxygenase n=2 Tax=Helianthus annuus TaxID=4232 RepID=A0A251TA79_HELAN|nr:putative premnaspirodiene oxygenase [Helianthus annuus]KAJ0502247.1 putative premnaspirodiene oxygenase [Helianthus annuus]KAJ0510250.1 putative premnaspirodiene oxygenase [Helianthus annuus]KAJ0518170.1 putative premnaspirodiene oxygenase [Helianthus annuus]KAJ0686199.1 putative premnaspirodiene oxygenase [Helianthus annuus]
MCVYILTSHVVKKYQNISNSNMVQLGFLLILVLPFFIIFFMKKRQQNLLLPPGPPKLPLIGNMHHLLNSTPHRALNDLAAKYGPIMHLKLGFISTIVISSAEAARQIMKTHDSIFPNRPKLVAPKILGYNYSDIAFAPYGSYWRQVKKICLIELSTAKSMNSTRFIREEEVKLFVESISKSLEHVDLVERLFALNHNIIARITMGDKLDDQLRLRLAIRAGTALAAGFQIGDFFPSLGFVGKLTGMNKRLEECLGELDDILDKRIQHHLDQRKLEKPERECFIDVLLRLQEAGDLEQPLTTDNIKSVILDMFTGATENSSNTSEWAMTELLRNPDMMKKAQTEIRQVIGEKANPILEETDLPKLNYLKMVVKETLRFHAPLPLLLPRESMERCVINGYEVPSQTRVLINYWAIARDPGSWKDPNVFNPERFQDETRDYRGHDFDYVPFGAGRRVCPGISLGMVNTQLALASLLYHFDWQLADGVKPQDLDMNETFGLTCYKTCSLRAVAKLRFPIST